MSRTARLLLFAFEAVLVLGYVTAFGVFVTQSRDFLVVRDNGRALAAAHALQPSLPARFDFGAYKPDNILLGVGWWRDEDPVDGVWSQSSSYVYVPTTSGTSRVVIDGETFVAPGHDDVDVLLTLDGTEAGRWTAHYGQPQPDLIADVPASALADGVLELRLDVHSPAVPFHFGDPEEKREVGFLMRSVSLEPSSNFGQELPQGQRVQHVAWFQPRPSRLRDAPVEVLELLPVVSVRVHGEAITGVKGSAGATVVQV